MSLVKPEDFAKALNISYGTIRSKISRGGLLRNKNKLIDTENPINYIYLLEVNGGDQSVFESYAIKPIGRANVRNKSTSASKTIKNIIVSKKEVITPEKIPPKSKKEENEKPSKIKGSVNIAPTVETKISPEEKKIMLEQKKANAALVGFELRKKEAEVKVVEHNAELKQWELEKKAGSTLPVNMIEKVIAINFKAIFKSIKSQSKNIAMVMVQQLGGSKEDLDSILEQLDEILDGTVKDAEKKSSVDLEKLLYEYSEIRSRGERKV